MWRQAYDAIVLAGGTGSRLGGVDKAAVEIAGRSLLDRSLDIVTAPSVVVVGDPRPTRHPVRWVREQPAGGGPAAAVAAALSHVRADAVVVLACDMPLVRPATPGRLVAALGEAAAAALLVDAHGNRQPLAAAYRTEALRAAVRAVGDPAGCSMRRLVGCLAVVEVAADAEEALDCDSWADVARSRRLLEGT